MLTFEIRFLTDRYAAGRYDDPAAPEWPPHPARVFSALTAALYEAPEPTAGERKALEWLAGAGAPEVVASDASERHLQDVYVPVNDVDALRSVDLYLARISDAIRKADELEGRAAAKADKEVAKLREKLRERSQATASADGKGNPDSAVEVLKKRPRHPRRFPVAVPHLPVVHLRWPEKKPPPGVRKELDRLSSRVARLGHSSSLVSMRLVEEGTVFSGDGDERVRWTPDPSGHEFLRVPLPDQLRRLDEAHAQHQQTEPRILPADSARYMRVRRDGAPVALGHSEFSDQADEWIVYEVVPAPGGGRRNLLDLSLAQQVARALRGTLLSSLDPEAPETLTGHGKGGDPTSRSHLAYVSLADVGHPHATGSILGVALVPPRDLSVADRDVLLEGIFNAERARSTGKEVGSGRSLRLTLGRAGVVHLSRLTEAPNRKTLTASRWCRPSRRWVSATAVALGRNPGKLRSRNPEVVRSATEAAEATVARACTFAGLPAPQAVWIHKRSLLTGAPEDRRFMPFPDQGRGPRRVCVHTEIVFEEPVVGPVLLGAGRFFGLGLHMPDHRAGVGISS